MAHLCRERAPSTTSDSDLRTRNKLCGLKACISLNHRVSLCDEERRHCEAKCLGGLKIDNQLKLGGLLNRQVGGFGTLEDLNDVPGRSVEQVAEVRPIRHQAAVFREVSLPVCNW